MASLTIFANFFIDTEERFLRMRDSFFSFKNITADRWVINIRGRHAKRAMDFLRSQLNDKLISYTLKSEEGWFYDTAKMLPDIQSDYVLIWMEDQINLEKTELLDRIVAEMKEKDLEYMFYTCWHKGGLRERYRGIPLTPGTYFDSFEHTLANNSTVQSNGTGSYLIAFPSIQKISLFKKIILAGPPKIGKPWPKETPFDFEKRPTDTQWLPIKVALPKQELFASIDDDGGCEGYCLQARGLYPMREKRKSYAIDERSELRKFLSRIKYSLSKKLHKK
jgi:hypothetical protein